MAHENVFDIIITPHRADLNQIRALRMSCEDWAYAVSVAARNGYYYSYGGCDRANCRTFLDAISRSNDARIRPLVAYLRDYCQAGFAQDRSRKKLVTGGQSRPTEQATKRDPLADVDMEMFRVDHAAAKPVVPSAPPENRFKPRQRPGAGR